MNRNRTLWGITLSLSLLIGCSTQESPTPTTSPDSVVQENTTSQHSDTAPQEDQAVQRDLLPTGAMAQMVLLSLAPERLCGLSSSLSPEQLAFYPPEIAELPVVGTIKQDIGSAQIEELLLISPAFLVDIGQTYDDTLSSLAELTEKTGIETLHVGTSIASMSETFLQLGEALDLMDRATLLADYCETAYLTTQEQAEALREEETFTLLYTQGDKGLHVLSKDSSHAEIIDLWSDNVAVLETPTRSGMGDEVDLEQIFQWNPDVILFGPNSIYDSVDQDPLWQNLSAIQEGAYYEVPTLPYHWMGMPASINCYLGLQWLGSVLYPSEIEFYDVIAEYMLLFYDYTLSEEEYLDFIS